MLAATLPVLLLASVDGQLTSAKQEADGGARLHEAVDGAERSTSSAYVSDHEHAVQSLAAALPAQPLDDARTASGCSTHYHDDLPGLHHALRRRSPAASCARSFRRADSESPPISDREYFIDAVQTRQLAVSDVILGRLSYVPIVTIAVPIFDAAGEVAGVAGGSLDLSKFERFVEDFRTLPDARITIVDQHDRA